MLRNQRNSSIKEPLPYKTYYYAEHDLPIIARENPQLNELNVALFAYIPFAVRETEEAILALIEAIKKNSGGKNSKLFPNIDNKNDFGNTALHLAAGKGQPLCVIRALLEAGADYNISSKSKGTPLIYAVEFELDNRLAVVKELMEKGNADQNIQGPQGNTALIFAAHCNKPEAAEYLISSAKNKPNLDIQNENGHTVLMIAADRNRISMVNQLIEAKANLNLQAKNNVTALILAVCNKNTAIALKLIQAGAALDLQDVYGNTALIHAARNGDAEIVKALVEAHANLDCQNNIGQTALNVASAHPSTAYDLIAAGANLNLRDGRGNTILILAASYGNLELVQTLVKAGADLHIQNKDGKTALDVAIRNENTSVVNYLLANQARVNDVNCFIQYANRLRDPEMNAIFQSAVEKIQNHLLKKTPAAENKVSCMGIFSPVQTTPSETPQPAVNEHFKEYWTP